MSSSTAATAATVHAPDVVLLATGGAPRDALLAAIAAVMDTKRTGVTAASVSRFTAVDSLSTARRIAEVRAALESGRLPEENASAATALHWTWLSRDGTPHSFVAPRCTTDDFAAVFGDDANADGGTFPDERLGALHREIFSSRYVFIVVNLSRALALKDKPEAHLERIDVEHAPATALTRLAGKNIRAAIIPVFDENAEALIKHSWDNDPQWALAECLPLLTSVAKNTGAAVIPVKISPGTPFARGVTKVVEHTDYFLANAITLEENDARELLRTDEIRKDWLIFGGFLLGAIICGGIAFYVAKDSIAIIAASALIGGSFGAGMSIVFAPTGNKNAV